MRVREINHTEEAALLPELVALAQRSKASWGYDEEFMAAFAATMVPTALVAPGRTTLVAEDGDTVIGFAILDDLGDVAWLEDLWVEPAHFRRGVGRALWEATIEVTRAQGYRTLELESDPNAEAFYLSRGATRFDERPSTLRPGRCLPLMRVVLSPSTS